MGYLLTFGTLALVLLTVRCCVDKAKYTRLRKESNESWKHECKLSNENTQLRNKFREENRKLKNQLGSLQRAEALQNEQELAAVWREEQRPELRTLVVTDMTTNDFGFQEYHYQGKRDANMFAFANGDGDDHRVVVQVPKNSMFDDVVKYGDVLWSVRYRANNKNVFGGKL